MVEEYKNSVKVNDIVESPADVTLDGIIINVAKGKLREFVKEQYHEKFDNLDQEQLLVKFEVKYENRIIKGEEQFTFFEKPLSNANLAKFLVKYGEVKPETKIKVHYNSKGRGKISLD